MNRQQWHTLFPTDIKEVIIDKLCEVDKTIHKDLMKELDYWVAEQRCDLYRYEIMVRNGVHDFFME